MDPTVMEAMWRRGGRGGQAGMQRGPGGGRQGVGVDPRVVEVVNEWMHE
jgi:hypothetical protein